MNNLFRNTSYLLLAASVAFISACSSSSDSSPSAAAVEYAGNLDPAAIDDLNALAIGTSAGESIQIADSSTGLPTGVSVNSGAGISMQELNDAVIASIDTSLNLPAGIDVPGVCSTGTADISDIGSATSGPVDITITYSNCVLIGEDITVNGSVTIHYNDISNIDSGFTATYNNFTVTDSLGTTTINMTMVCTSGFSCTFNSDFVGSDGITHRVSDFSISGSGSTGDEFFGSATFYHGTHGSVSITVTGVTYGACGSIPDGGTISFISSDGSSGSVTFHPDCSISGDWSDGIGGAGTF